MSEIATPRNNEIGIADQRKPHGPEGAKTTKMGALRGEINRHLSALDTLCGEAGLVGEPETASHGCSGRAEGGRMPGMPESGYLPTPRRLARAGVRTWRGIPTRG
jgi:hypothetical protein